MTAPCSTPASRSAAAPRSGRSAARPAAAALLAAIGLAGCADSVDHFGRAPTMSPVAESRTAIDPSLPASPVVDQQQAAAYAAYETAPAPVHSGHVGRAAGRASLWTSGPGSLFDDRRARQRGDILTVLIAIDDSAEIDADTSRERDSADDASVGAFFGLTSIVERILPDDATLSPAIQASSASSSTGSGSISRTETIDMQVAATVVDVLPNGHLVIAGSQEVRVNHELRDLQIVGVVRPEDISRTNTITLEKIANARVSYGGRGQISDVQRTRPLSQVVEQFSPL